MFKSAMKKIKYKTFFIINFTTLKKISKSRGPMLKQTYQWLLGGYVITTTLGKSFGRVNQEP